jgi:polysaccharide pyruvyl transferase WcaK-like protein
MRRRQFAASLAALFQKPATVLLRSGWQTVNIGDIAHTPGLLSLLEAHAPQLRVILWSNATDLGVDEMLLRRFPRISIISGEPYTPAVSAAFRDSDFFLHGSGPGVVARAHLDAWRSLAKKPYGLFGVTITRQSEAASAALDESLVRLLNGARFVFTRETASLANVQEAQVSAPCRFVPDATFSLRLGNPTKAADTLRRLGLDDPGFLVLVPRLRYTPYHQFRTVTTPPEEIRRRDEVNARHAEPDHQRLRALATRWVRETKRMVLLAPEMSYQVPLLKTLLFDPLPEDVKRRTRYLRQYWITDEAASVYAKAAAVVSFECHSPIIAVSQGVPGFYVHQPEDGIKGRMWSDVGLGAFYSRIEETTGDSLAGRVLPLASDAAPTLALLAEPRARIAGLHRAAVATLSESLF